VKSAKLVTSLWAVGESYPLPVFGFLGNAKLPVGQALESRKKVEKVVHGGRKSFFRIQLMSLVRLCNSSTLGKYF